MYILQRFLCSEGYMAGCHCTDDDDSLPSSGSTSSPLCSRKDYVDIIRKLKLYFDVCEIEQLLPKSGMKRELGYLLSDIFTISKYV